MRMMGERLPPGVEDGDEADLAAQVPGIGGDGLQRRGDGVEQDAVDHGLVVEGDGRNLGGQSEHDVEVRDRQQVGFAGGEPSFTRAPPGTSGNGGYDNCYR